MNEVVKKYWKNWLILLLALMNLSTLATILYGKHCNERPEIIVAGEKASPVNAPCFREKLGLTPVQEADFKKINQAFREKICVIITCLNQEKNTMFGALQLSQPDTVQLRQMARSIGNLHYQLKEETVRFYLAVKSLCNPEQQQILKEYFTPLFQHPDCPDPSDCEKHDCPDSPSSEIFKP